MKLSLIAVLAAVCLHGVSAGSIFGLTWKCSGLFCKTMQVDVVQIDPVAGKMWTVGTFVPEAPKEQVAPLTAMTAYDPATKTYFALMTDTVTNTNTLYSFSNTTGATTKVVVPYFLSNTNISAIEFDTQDNQLIGNYGAQLVSFDLKTGATTPITQMFSPTYFYSGSVSNYNQFSNSYMLTVFPASDNGCYYIYIVDLASKNTTAMPCIPSPTVNPGNWALEVFASYNATVTVSLWTDILGGNINLYNPKTQSMNGVFGPSDFAGWDWFLSADPETIAFDATTDTIWMLVEDDNNNNFMGGVVVESKKGIQGANFDSEFGEVRNFEFMF